MNFKFFFAYCGDDFSLLSEPSNSVASLNMLAYNDILQELGNCRQLSEQVNINSLALLIAGFALPCEST